uniref:Uncharacterized protein n=1 Tax=Eptatretus burgeri TaxID=7764 RepID=A0A8C4WVJ1_EPTBU
MVALCNNLLQQLKRCKISFQSSTHQGNFYGAHLFCQRIRLISCLPVLIFICRDLFESTLELAVTAEQSFSGISSGRPPVSDGCFGTRHPGCCSTWVCRTPQRCVDATKDAYRFEMENLQSLSEEVLAGALQTFVQEGTKLLNAVSADAVSNSVEDFLETKVNKLRDSIPIICSLMESLCIYNRKQLEDLWKRYKYSTIQKCVDEALSFEGSSAEQLPRKGIPSAARNAAPSCLSTMTRACGTATGSPGSFLF